MWLDPVHLEPSFLLFEVGDWVLVHTVEAEENLVEEFRKEVQLLQSVEGNRLVAFSSFVEQIPHPIQEKGNLAETWLIFERSVGLGGDHLMVQPAEEQLAPGKGLQQQDC